jgi:hypothetical protein
MDLLGNTERSNKAMHDEWVNAAIEYKNGWEQVFQRCDTQGIARPAPLPHPDHIVVDLRSGQVHVKGPMTNEDKVKWDEWRRLKKDCDAAIRQYEEDLRQPEYEPYRKFILDEIEHEKKIRAMISQIIKD